MTKNPLGASIAQSNRDQLLIPARSNIQCHAVIAITPTEQKRVSTPPNALLTYHLPELANNNSKNQENQNRDNRDGYNPIRSHPARVLVHYPLLSYNGR